MKTEILTAIDSREFIRELAPLLRDELDTIINQKSNELTRAEYLNIKESCAYCGLSRAKFLEIVQYTGTQAINALGKTCYKRSDLDEMMKSFYK